MVLNRFSLVVHLVIGNSSSALFRGNSVGTVPSEARSLFSFITSLN